MKPGTLLNRQPQHIKDHIAAAAKTQHYGVIVAWLNDQGIDATYDQLRYYVATNNLVTRLHEIKPVKGYAAKARIYINALLEYDTPTFTINNLRLHGPSWSIVSVRLHRDRLIEPMRAYPPMRWRILASKDELKEWYESELLRDAEKIRRNRRWDCYD